MRQSFILSNSNISNFSAVSAQQNLSISGAAATAWVAMSFWAYDNITINRVAFSTGAITNNTGFKVQAGIGTWLRRSYIPSTLGGTGVTLNFNSSKSATGITQNSWVIFDIPDYSLTKTNRYFVGVGVSEPGGVAYTLNIGLHLFNNNEGNFTSDQIVLRDSTTRRATDATGVNMGNEYMPFNWGYDSGSGDTIWYNPNPGASTFSALGAFITQHQGFTLYFNTDVNRFLLDGIKVPIRSPLSFGYAATAQTWTVVLYDSDGTTALTATTTYAYSQSTSNPFFCCLPIKYWLNNNQLYHVSLIGEGSVSTTVLTGTMPFRFQSGLAMTSIRYTKSSAVSAPSYFPDSIIPFHLNISDTLGNRQGGLGNEQIY